MFTYGIRELKYKIRIIGGIYLLRYNEKWEWNIWDPYIFKIKEWEINLYEVNENEVHIPWTHHFNYPAQISWFHILAQLKYYYIIVNNNNNSENYNK